MTGLHQQVDNHLKNLIDNKEKELTDLIYCLGYEYDNEIVDALFSSWTEGQKSLVNQVIRLGHHGEFSIFWIRLNSERLNKIAQRTVINLINRQFPYNLIIFSNLSNSIWDFVNIKAVKDKQSDDDKEPKKRQFLRRIRVDQKDRLRKAVDRISLLKVPDDCIHHFDLQKLHDEAFDVEKVTESFFLEFKDVFTDFKNYLSELSKDVDWAHEYGLQFFNRLMFIYFIQKKRWLGDDIEFIKSYCDSYQSSNQPEDTFVDRWIGILFFEAFNYSGSEQCGQL